MSIAIWPCFAKWSPIKRKYLQPFYSLSIQSSSSPAASSASTDLPQQLVHMQFYSNQVRSYTFPTSPMDKTPWLVTLGSSDKETPPNEVRPSALSLRIRRRSQHSTSHGCSKHSWRWHPKAVFLEIQTPPDSLLKSSNLTMPKLLAS